MKPLILLSTLLFTSAFLSAQSPYDLFVKEFGQAIKFNNEAGMQKAIKQRPNQAVTHFEFITRDWIAKRNEETNRKLMDQMKDLFGKAYEGSEVLDKIERYYTRLDLEKVPLIDKAVGQRDKLYTEWVKFKAARDKEAILELVDQGLALGRRFEELGHQINAALTYHSVAAFLNTIPNQTTKDIDDAIETIRMYLRCRKSWGYTQDPDYIQWANWVKQKTAALKEKVKKADERKKAGLDDSADGIGKFVDTKAPVLSSPLTFKALKALPQDSFFLGGSVPVNWISTRIEDTPAKMDWFKATEVFLVRTGNAKVGVALNSAGAKPQEVKAGSRVKPSLFYLDQDKKRPYAMAFYVGGEAEPFAAAVSNMAPTKEALTVRYRSASSWEATIDTVPITFFDDNCDGRLFTTDPMEFGYKTRTIGQGPKDEITIPCYDSMKIGKKGVVGPFSSCAKINDKWYQLVSANDGKSVEARPLHPAHFKTGTVTMKWSGSRAVKPQVLIIRGRTELLSAAFNIASGKPVEVPAGEYEIVYGRAAKGKGARTQMAHVFRGSSELIKVEPGKNKVIKMGAPFKLDFVRGGDGDDVVIDSLYFTVKGAYGEIYTKIQGPTPAPEVIVAKTANGRGGKTVAEYIPIGSAELLNAAAATLDAALKGQNVRGMGAEVGYFPVVKGDKSAPTILKFKSPIPGGLVGLRVKKHKMFGKIEPIFK